MLFLNPRDHHSSVPNQNRIHVRNKCKMCMLTHPGHPSKVITVKRVNMALPTLSKLKSCLFHSLFFSCYHPKIYFVLVFVFVYHEISHLSPVFFWCSCSPQGSRVYRENASDSLDIPRHSTTSRESSVT